MVLNSYELWTYLTLLVTFIFCVLITVLDVSEIRPLKNKKVSNFFRKALIAQVIVFILAIAKESFFKDKRGAWTITGQIVLYENTQNINAKNSSITLTPPLVTIHDDGFFESKVIFEKESGEWLFPTLKVTMPHTYAPKTIHLNPEKFAHIEGMSNEYSIVVNANKKTISIKTPIELDKIVDKYTPSVSSGVPEAIPLEGDEL